MSVELVGPVRENLGSSVSRMPPVNSIISSWKMDLWARVINCKTYILGNYQMDFLHHYCLLRLANLQMANPPSSKLVQICLHHLHRKAVPQFLQAFEIIININQ